MIRKKKATKKKTAKAGKTEKPIKPGNELLLNKHAREFLLQVAGENALSVVREIAQPMSDERLAENCRLKVSDVRAVLNKLHNYGVVDYERTRDKESGWYSYTWKLRPEAAVRLLAERRENAAKEIEERLMFARSYNFFGCLSCKKKGEKIPFEIAVEWSFKCPSCGGALSYWDNRKDIRELEAELKRARAP